MICDPLEGYGGSIQAALTVDLEGESISLMDISIHGLNGMQPNLDLVHVLGRIATYENVPVKLEFQVLPFLCYTSFNSICLRAVAMTSHRFIFLICIIFSSLLVYDKKIYQ